jgi:hypothetical protein
LIGFWPHFDNPTNALQAGYAGEFYAPDAGLRTIVSALTRPDIDITDRRCARLDEDLIALGARALDFRHLQNFGIAKLGELNRSH